MSTATMSAWRPPYGTMPPSHRVDAYTSVPSSSSSSANWASMSVAMRALPKRKASDDELQEVSKEEILKEKNRIKQRNLRERRANQLSNLETNVTTLTQTIDSLKDTLSASQAREASLQQWVEALESTLVGANLSHAASQLRSQFSGGGGQTERLHSDPHQRPQFIPLPHLNHPTQWQPNDYPTPNSNSYSHSYNSNSNSSAASTSLQLRTLSPPGTPPGPDMADLYASWPSDPMRLATGDNGLPTFGHASTGSTMWNAVGLDRMPFMGYTEPMSASPSFWAPPPVIAVPLAHPTIVSARKLLEQIYMSTPAPLPSLPSLIKPQIQHLMLLALRNLSPPAEQEYYARLQLANLSPADSAIVLSHAQSPSADPRIIHFPSVLLRLRMIQAGPTLDITAFIASVFQEARIFGRTTDFHAWEMPDDFWMQWEAPFPGAKHYCGSLKEWRRRDGHTGASIQDIIMGCEEPRSRRTDSVGYPPNWRFARAQSACADSPLDSAASTISVQA